MLTGRFSRFGERPAPWPVGEYRVKIMVSGRGIKTLRESFRVAATLDTTLEFVPE